MKYAVLLCFLLLMGCAPVPTLEELENQAMLTGNWSEVERRQKIIANRNAERGLGCQAREVALCVKDIGKTVCTCIERNALRGIVARR